MINTAHKDFSPKPSYDEYTEPAPDGVILLHGLGRTNRSMKRMATALEAEGFVVLNVGYRSRQATIEELAEEVITKALDSPELAAVSKIHFVTHSMGGILVRQYLGTTDIARLGNVVMLGPPNHGSEVVDALSHLWLFRIINGPAGGQLGTAPDSPPNQLGPVTFNLGVIAGDRSINWINSMMINGPDDGKVSVTRTRVSGMKDHMVVHATHPFLMRNRNVISETIHFLQNGLFSPGCGNSKRLHSASEEETESDFEVSPHPTNELAPASPCHQYSHLSIFLRSL